MEKFWKVALGVAGIGAVGMFVLWSLYKDWLKLPYFVPLSQDQTFRLFRYFLFLTFGAAVLGVGAWIIRGRASTEVAPSIPRAGAPKPDPQIASLLSVLKQRAEEIQSDLEKVIQEMTKLHRDDAIKQLKEFELRFLGLHKKHLAAIKANDLHLSHEIIGQIHELIFKTCSLVSSTVGTVGREWYASLGRAYADAPTTEEDPEYAAIQNDMLELTKATTLRTDAMHYPGEVPAAASKSLANLVFGPLDTPPKSSK
jgi:hypothetical protein